MNNPKLLVLITIICWSFGSLLTRLISINSQLLSLTLLFFFTFLFFCIYSGVQQRKNLLTTLKKIKLRYVFFGLFGYFFYYLGLIQSFHFYNSASQTTILNYTFPIFTVLFTELFLYRKKKDRKVKAIEYTGVLLGFLAVIVLATQGDFSSFQVLHPAAFLWGLSAGIAYGIFSSFSSTIPTKDQNIFLLTSIFASWLLSLIIAFPQLHDLSTLRIQDYGVLLLLAFVVNGLGFIMWTKANRIALEKKIPAASFTSLLYILPFLSLVIIAFFLKETSLFQSYSLISIVLLIVSSILSQNAAKLTKLIDFHR